MGQLVNIFAGLILLFLFNDALASQNIIINPSFERGRLGWYYREGHPAWNNYLISDKVAHSGKKSAYFPLRAQPGEEPPRIWGIIQELNTSQIPENLSLWYRADRWKQGTERQFIQVVIMVHDEKFKKKLGDSTMQLRYILAGIAKPPYPETSNCKYIMVGSQQPFDGEWILFKRNVKNDFLKTWGWTPKKFQKIELFLESRYEDEISPRSKINGSVYWDDVIVTP